MGLIIPFLLIVILVIGIVVGGGFLISALILDIILVFLSIKIVTPNTVRTVEFLGKFTRILRPGINFLIPFVEWTRLQHLFKQNFSVEVDGITHDNVTVYVGLNVIYFVDDDGDNTSSGNIYKSIYSINDHRTMISSSIDEQLRAMVATFSHKEIFSKREEIGEAIEEKLREKLSQFGYTLDSIQVKNIKLEGSVMAAMNKVVESLKLKEAAQNEGEAEKILQVKRAEADKEAKILIGQGMAGQRMEIAKGFKESVDMIMSSDKSLTGDKILKFLLDSSRIETLGNIGNSDKTKLVYLNEDLEGRGMNKEAKLIAGSDLMK